MNTVADIDVCPTKLSDAQLQQFHESGYIAFRDVLSKSEVEAAQNAIAELCNQLVTDKEGVEYTAPLQNQTTLRNHIGGNFKRKGTRLWMQLEPGFDASSTKDSAEVELKARKLMGFCECHEDLGCLIEPSSKLYAVVSALIGENPIFFQQMALIKPPFIGSEKPWHQDSAYFSIAPLNAAIGVWIALDDAHADNGCMHVIPGGHKIGGLKHFHGTDCEIVENRIDASKSVPVTVPAGGAMFFYAMLPHQTPPNHSPDRRRALQFHFRSATSEVLDKDAYSSVFVEGDGSPASCAAAG